MAQKTAGQSRSRVSDTLSEAASGPALPAIEEILTLGGDTRLALNSDGQNAYGCAPCPKAELIDFGSSTASTISPEAYAHIRNARAEFLAKVASQGITGAFEDCVSLAREKLLSLLELKNDGAEAIFAASGTDAQIYALFLAKNLLGARLTTIVVGSDQTGSGTAFTAKGLHFNSRTSNGRQVEKGLPVGSLADTVNSVAIPFEKTEGVFRSAEEMDRDVLEAVRRAAVNGGKILLQAMDASKFGWRAPSYECIRKITAEWPHQVQVVVDACQMRINHDHLKALMQRGCMVLTTGSKFFTGPAFSGAILVPKPLCRKLRSISGLPDGLSAYTSKFDWPANWTIRSKLSGTPNYGQWLRWEAALEEMRLYYAVPSSFRHDLQAKLGGLIEEAIGKSRHLRSMTRDQGLSCKGATIFPLLAHRNGKTCSPSDVRTVYRAMPSDLSELSPVAYGEDPAFASTQCQVGQPVLLVHQDTAALRLAISSRIIRECWSPLVHKSRRRIAAVAANIANVIRKLDLAVANLDRLESAMTERNSVSLCADWDACCITRMGFGAIVRASIAGIDLSGIWNDFMERATDDAAGSGMGMDLSVIAQLRGEKEVGLAIQNEMLALQQIFRTRRDGGPAKLRVLAFAAASDVGANTPLELLLEGADIDLAICYLTAEHPIPRVLPDHDVAIVVAPGTPDGAQTLEAVEKATAGWPRPILNLPPNIRSLERDCLHQSLRDVPGLHIPATVRVSRESLRKLAAGETKLPSLGLSEAAFPIIARPIGSHAGKGLSLVESAQAVSCYLDEQPEGEFFVSPFIDFSGADGLFRKYRIAFVDRRPFASHMAISDEWKVWYASADMAVNVENRIAEADWMTFFDDDFARKHRVALGEMAARVNLDYFVVDCAETRDGELLIFEADNTAIVHDFDPPNVFPYKSAHMQKLFAAFVAMLQDKAARPESRAA